MTGPDFENKLKETGIKPGSGDAAQKAAKQTASGRADFARNVIISQLSDTDRRPIKKDLGVIDPKEILPPSVYELVGIEPEASYEKRAHGLALKYLAASWAATSALGASIDFNPLIEFNKWQKQDAERRQNSTPEYKGFVIDQVSCHLQERLINSLQEKGKNPEEFIWENRIDAAILFTIGEVDIYGGVTKEKTSREAYGALLQGDEATGKLIGNLASKRDGYSSEGDTITLMAIPLYPEIAATYPLLSTAVQQVRPWGKQLENRARQKNNGYSGLKTPVLENLIVDRLHAEVESGEQYLSPNSAFEEILSLPIPERFDAISRLPDSRWVIEPTDTILGFMSGNLTEAEFPSDSAEELLRSLQDQPEYDWIKNMRIANTKALYPDLIDKLTEDILRHQQYGKRMLLVASDKLSNQETATTGKTNVNVQVGIRHMNATLTAGEVRCGFVVSSLTPFSTKATNPDDLSVKWQTSGFKGSYEELISFVGGLPEIPVGNIELNEDFHLSILYGELNEVISQLRTAFPDQITGMFGTIIGDFDLRVANTPSANLSETFVGFSRQLGNPFMVIALKLATAMIDRGVLSKSASELEVNLPFINQLNLGVSADDPYSILKALARLSPDEISLALKKLVGDIEIPEVTLSKSGQYTEIMNQEGAYAALEAMRQSGFDVFLGKEMAREFSYQAAKIFVESILPAVGYELDKNTLGNWQAEIVTIAGDCGYRGNAGKFVERKLRMTFNKELELLTAIRASGYKFNVGGFDLDQYEKARAVIEKVMDFAEENGITGFKRYSELPAEPAYRATRGTRSLGNYGISQEAQRHFVDKAIDWRNFLEDLPAQLELPGIDEENYSQMKKLGQKIYAELGLMGHGNVIDRAMQIIRGEVAAVGEDITVARAVNTWSDFFSSLRELLKTPKIHLLLSSETSKLGFTISPRDYSK